jgi:hypothetical protein
MGMKSSDQADSGGDWRVQLQDMRTISAMRAGSPHPDEVERLSDRALRAAALNPDHSDEARAAAAAALRARRLSAEPWRVRVPSYLSAKDLERGDALFFGAWRRTTRLAPLVSIASLVVAATLAWANFAQEQADIKAVAAALEPCLATGACTAENLAAELAGLHSVWPDLWTIAFAALSLIAALAWMGLALLGVRPARVCVIRPDVGSARRPLRSAIASEIRPYGHAISLASGVEGLTVKSAADYRARTLDLGNRIGLTWANMTTRRETLALSATDQWRPLVLNLLLDSSDAIVVDLSDGGSWALEAIQREGVAQRCVFVALWGRLEEAEAALRAVGLSQRVFPYAPDGEMQRRPLFRAAMLEAMRATHAADA